MDGYSGAMDVLRVKKKQNTYKYIPKVEWKLNWNQSKETLDMTYEKKRKINDCFEETTERERKEENRLKVVVDVRR